ncbi:MAG: hypothetical protein LBS50_09590 [Prevotellaceae bacterium]|jgi:hypothetical protein|nr:hypothetical protein [Prevotellaceae bacterium]
MRFCLTASQQQAFNTCFAPAQIPFFALYGDDYIATVRRFGIDNFPNSNDFYNASHYANKPFQNAACLFRY